MSDVINNGEFNPGCIYRIALQNFVCYKEVELFPGKSLNLIIGPNGTGKSTFVCAIILGLCGKPSSIGKDNKISTYIKNDSQTASIEIELYNKKGMKNIIIKRTFNQRDVSKWFINYENATEKKVQTIIKSLNIQVDNLCQLLPQDRVQEFSALKPKELLECTLKAVGKEDSIEKWNKLIELRSELLNMTTNMTRNVKNLEKHKRNNESLKQQIEEINKRKQIEREIEMCKKKQHWLELQELKSKVMEYEKEKKKMTKLVKSHEIKMEPYKNELERLKIDISQLERQKLSNSREFQDLKEQLKKSIKAFEMKENELKIIDASYQEKLNTHRNKETKLTQAKLKLDKLNLDMRALVHNEEDENKLKFELEDVTEQKKSVNATIETLKNRSREVNYYLDNNIRMFKNKIRNLEDVQMKRLETLKRHKLHTYKALMWLRDNKEKFKHPVYEPMMLEINYTDSKFARYLESTVPARDLIAFTFESTEDMNLFNRIVRNELHLKQVNAVCSQGGDFSKHSRDLRNLRYLGFYTCILDTITAPAAILRYLCTLYHIDRIPIGNNHTYNNSDKVPEDIPFYFTEHHRFSVRVSAYGVKSCTTIEISNPFLLANTVDEQEILNLKNQLIQHQQKKQVVNNEIDDELTGLEKKLQEFNHRGKEKRELFDKIKSTKTKIQLQTIQIRALETEPTIDIEQEKAACQQNYKDCVKKQCFLNSEMSNVMNKIHNKTLVKMEICTLKLNARRDEMLQKDSDYSKLKSEFQTATSKLEDIERNSKIIKSKAKQKSDEVNRIFDKQLPNTPDFPYAREFNDLPSDIVQLHEYKNERLTTINLMENVDIQALRDYAYNNKEIERLTNIVTSSDKTSSTIKDDINKIKSAWLPALESLVEEISVNFAEMFKKPGCAGEVILNKENGDEDFSAYGVVMMVKFRPNEPLSRMTRVSQSGGERAFCTAIYLLALQARTVAPFRCVDEINQGLDVKNERIMLQLLIRETTKCNSQYFLLTPTLLLNLEYNEKVKIHTVMNGNHIVNYKKWNHREFLKKAKIGLN